MAASLTLASFSLLKQSDELLGLFISITRASHQVDRGLPHIGAFLKAFVEATDERLKLLDRASTTSYAMTWSVRH